MDELSYSEINDTVLGPLRKPRPAYYMVMGLLAAAMGWMLFCWVCQIRLGMGVAGISHPVGWGVYIANFVFWVGIAHSGTLISAILHLVRAKWRDAVSRSAEAMTVIAVLTAGLFPLIHLGRFWVFYYIIPYPSERQLWPNFVSPIVWDVLAVSTYLIVSSIFFYVGLIPDLASARDRYEKSHGANHFRTRLYRRLALGWAGSANQWRHYGRGYLYFAALATPLVVSVHSVVSWDFAMGILPGWHTTIFPPYFVAGAIHSGLAMVLILVIPMRRILKIEKIITVSALQSMAQTMLVTTCIVGYAYLIEPFIAWYSGDIYEQQFAWWRATGWMAVIYWALVPLNVLAPLLFFFRRIRQSLPALFTIAVMVQVGMWLERVFIVVGSTSHDFLPHNWGAYAPTWTEISITLGSLAFFMFWFLGFAKLLPTVATTEYKELVAEHQSHGNTAELPADPRGEIANAARGVLAVFARSDDMLKALAALREKGFERLELFSPVRVGRANRLLGLPRGPVRYWTLAGAVLGFLGGFALAIGAALVNGLIVGGKPPVALIPYCIPAFEGTILLGTLANFTGMLVHARLGRTKLPPAYDKRFSNDKFGLFVECDARELKRISSLIAPMKPLELHTIGPSSAPAAQE